MFFRRKATAEVPAATTHTLFVHVADGGLTAQLVDGRNPDSRDEERREAPNLEADGDARFATLVKLAANLYPQKKLALVGNVHVLVDDPKVQFVDAKGGRFRTPNPSALREFGAHYLHVEEVTFGQRKFVVAARNDSPRGNEEVELVEGERKSDNVYAFIDVGRLRNYLSVLEGLALKVVSFAPVGDLLLRRSAQSSSGSYAALYATEFNTFVVLADQRECIAVVRTLPIGKMTFVQAVARENGIAVSEALAALAKRDHLSSIRLSEETEGNLALTRDAHERILAPVFEEYFDAIRQTVDYFVTQRMSRRPSSIEVFGDLDALKGFKEVLARNLGVPTTFISDRLIDLFRASAGEPAINLLAGAADSLVTVGKVKYTFFNQRFVTADALARETAIVEETVPGVANVQSRVRKIRDSRAAPSRKAAKSNPPLMARIGGLFSGRSARGATDRDSPRGDAGAASNDRQYLMLFGLVVFGILYGSWYWHESVDLRFQGQVSRVAEQLVKNANLRKELAILGTTVPGAAVKADKVLWSEKFLSLASNLTNAMWLTDVYLTDQPRQIGKDQVLSKKLTIEGAVLPSTDGHILEVAQYVKRLLGDAQNFMSDFREITFEGAHIDTNETDHVVRFAIEAWYDENKRLKSAVRETRESGSPIEQMQQNVDTHNETLDRSVGPGVKR